MGLSRIHREHPAPEVQINVVPLVDVSLVLLIIFMVTATFVRTAGMKLELPQSSVTRAAGESKRELTIGVSAGGAFSWNGTAVDDRDLAAALRTEAARFHTDSRITLRGDARAAHGRVVEAMSMAEEAGFTRLVIATRLPSGSGDEHETSEK